MKPYLWKISAIIKVILTIIILTCLTLLVRYGIADYKQRMQEQQSILKEAQLYKTHPLVINGCKTDSECERLDEMLDVIYASYTLD